MHRAAARSDRGLVRLFFVLVAVPMFAVFPYLRDLNNPNEYSRVFTTMMLVEKGTFIIDEPVATYGWINDMAHAPGLDPTKTPHYTMVKAPGATYLGIPGYFVFSKIVAPLLGHKTYATPQSTNEEKLWWLRGATWSMRLFGTQLPCFLFLLWFERYLRAFVRDTPLRLVTVAACGLGTNYLAYTHIFASHSQYAAVAFMAFAIVERERRKARRDVRKRSWKAALVAGWCTSACVMLEYHALFLTVLLSLFALTVFWRPTRLLAFGIGGAVNVPLVMLFHWRAYGNPLTPGHQMLETQSFSAIHSTGLWGVVWPSWEHIEMLSLDPGFGFFGMSPFMGIGVIGMLFLAARPFGDSQHRRDVRLAAIRAFLCGALLIALNAGIVNFRAGWTVGPRYLVAAAPFFAFLGGLSLDRLAGRSETRLALARGLGGGLALASILSIGTVGLVHDTLPETIRRPFLQFAVPMAWVGFVPHHIGEWFGWTSTTLWYIACGAMLLAAIVPALFARVEHRRVRVVARTAAFVVALCCGMIPAFLPPEDNSRLWVVHQPAAFGPFWEPAGRDRIALLRIEAERHGSRGRGPCLWLKLAELEEIAGMSQQSMRSRAKAGAVTRQQCGMRQIYPLPHR